MLIHWEFHVVRFASEEGREKWNREFSDYHLGAILDLYLGKLLEKKEQRLSRAGKFISQPIPGPGNLRGKSFIITT